MCFSVNTHSYKKFKYNSALLRPIAGTDDSSTSIKNSTGDIRVKGADKSKGGPIVDVASKTKIIGPIAHPDCKYTRVRRIEPERGRSRTVRPLGEAFDRQCPLCAKMFVSISGKDLHIKRKHEPDKGLQEASPDSDCIEIVVHPGTPPLSDGGLTDNDSSSDSLDMGLLTPNDAIDNINLFSGEVIKEENKEKEEPATVVQCRIFRKFAEIFKEENELFDKEHGIVSSVNIGKDREVSVKAVITADVPPANIGNSYDPLPDLTYLGPGRVRSVMPNASSGHAFKANLLSPIIEVPAILFTPSTPKPSLGAEFQHYEEDSSTDGGSGSENLRASYIDDVKASLIDAESNNDDQDGSRVAKGVTQMLGGDLEIQDDKVYSKKRKKANKRAKKKKRKKS